MARLSTVGRPEAPILVPYGCRTASTAASGPLLVTELSKILCGRGDQLTLPRRQASFIRAGDIDADVLISPQAAEVEAKGVGCRAVEDLRTGFMIMWQQEGP